MFALLVVPLFAASTSLRAADGMDVPFAQAISRKYALPVDLRGKVKEICIDREGIVYLRSELGVARLFDTEVRLDQSYRPLAGKVAKDLTVAGGKLYYLFPDEALSNRDAGKFVRKLPREFQSFAVNSRNEVLLGQDRKLSILRATGLETLAEVPQAILDLVSDKESFIAITANGAYDPFTSKFLAELEGTTAATFHRGSLVIGTTNGFLVLDSKSSTKPTSLQRKLPAVGISSLASDGTNLWAGTTQGVWRRAEDGTFRYFASKPGATFMR